MAAGKPPDSPRLGGNVGRNLTNQLNKIHDGTAQTREVVHSKYHGQVSEQT